MNRKPPAPDAADLLLEYLRERDVPCPGCGYDLRDLAQPRCPECREDLALSVGFRKPRFGWLLVTVTPGLFSGICAGLLLIPIFVLSGVNRPPWQILLADGFGWTSGLVALGLIRCRYTFIRWPEGRQRAWGIAAWIIHVAAFISLIVLVLLFQ